MAILHLVSQIHGMYTEPQHGLMVMSNERNYVKNNLFNTRFGLPKTTSYPPWRFTVKRCFQIYTSSYKKTHKFLFSHNWVGIIVNGKVINNLKNADDTVLLASTNEDLQDILNKVVSGIIGRYMRHVTHEHIGASDDNSHLKRSFFQGHCHFCKFLQGRCWSSFKVVAIEVFSTSSNQKFFGTQQNK